MLLFFYVYFIYVWETQIDKNHEHNFVFMFIITQHELEQWAMIIVKS